MAEIVYLEYTFISIFSQPIRSTKSNPYEMIFYGEFLIAPTGRICLTIDTFQVGDLFICSHDSRNRN